MHTDFSKTAPRGPVSGHRNHQRTLRGRGVSALGIAVVMALSAFPATAVTTKRPARTRTTTSTSVPPLGTVPTLAPTTIAPVSTTPIRIMVTYIDTVSTNTQFILAAAKARAEAQNAAGGVKGRKVEIVPCNMKFDLAASEACARLAVSSKVDAYIAAAPLVAAPPSAGLPGGVSDTATVIPILADGGVPWLGAFLTAGGLEASSPVAFPISSAVVSVAGAAIALVNDGCRRIAFLGGAVGREPFRKGLASKGMEPVFEGLFSFSDPAAVIPALAARSVDCIYLGALDTGIKTFVEAADRAGQAFRYAWVNDLVSERTLAQLGPTLDGSIVSGSSRSGMDLSDPSVRQYRTELDKNYRGQKYDSGGFIIWGGVDMVMQVARGIDGDVNAATLLKAFRTFKGTTVLFGPIDFTRELGNPQYRRMFMTNAFTYRIVLAKPVRTGEPLNLAPVFDKVS